MVSSARYLRLKMVVHAEPDIAATLAACWMSVSSTLMSSTPRTRRSTACKRGLSGQGLLHRSVLHFASAWQAGCLGKALGCPHFMQHIRRDFELERHRHVHPPGLSRIRVT